MGALSSTSVEGASIISSALDRPKGQVRLYSNLNVDFNEYDIMLFCYVAQQEPALYSCNWAADFNFVSPVGLNCLDFHGGASPWHRQVDLLHMAAAVCGSKVLNAQQLPIPLAVIETLLVDFNHPLLNVIWPSAGFNCRMSVPLSMLQAPVVMHLQRVLKSTGKNTLKISTPWRLLIGT